MNILIIDDDPLVSTALKTILEADPEIKVLATGNSGEEAIELFRQHSPDILLMDIRMGEKNGIQTAKEILVENAQANILFLTTFTDNDYIIQALRIGAKGYLLKQDYENILPALKAVYGGQNVFGNAIVSKIPNLFQEKKEFNYREHEISDKELEFIKLVANAYTNKEIAEKLHLSEGTVRNYISIILEKLCLRDRTQLAVFYYQNK